LHHNQDKKTRITRLGKNRKEIKRFITSLDNRVNETSFLLSKERLRKKIPKITEPTDSTSLFDLA